MKIGIITILKINNYGAELQAYALQKKLELIGYDSEIIDYLYYKNPCFNYTKMAKPLIHIGFVNIIKERLGLLISKYKIMIKNAPTSSKIDSFHRNHTKLSLKTYHTIDELYNDIPEYDVYMVGSDQVWNPRTYTSLQPYFLTFAPKEKKTISYASSFGVTIIPKNAERVYSECLSHIKHLSVREKQGVDIIYKLTGRAAIHVLDPTLLLTSEDWDKIAVFSSMEKPYVLLYDIICSPYAIKLAIFIASIYGYDVVRIGNKKQNIKYGIISILDVGPSEFIGLFSKAEFVITNSFHGTAFSIIYNKPFYTVIPNGKKNTSRLISLLDSLDLSSRILMEDSQYPSSDVLSIDFTSANLLLEKERINSLDFLQNSLNA